MRQLLHKPLATLALSCFAGSLAAVAAGFGPPEPGVQTESVVVADCFDLAWVNEGGCCWSADGEMSCESYLECAPSTFRTRVSGQSHSSTTSNGTYTRSCSKCPAKRLSNGNCVKAEGQCTTETITFTRLVGDNNCPSLCCF